MDAHADLLHASPMRHRRAALFCFLAGLLSCGARTGLLVGDHPEPQPTEESTDAGLTDAAPDAPDAADAAHDADAEADAAHDADADAADAQDAPDVQDAAIDVVKIDCVDPDKTQIYVITEGNELLSFDPTNNQFHLIALLSCPAAPGATPFSMAVDRKGIAYSVFNDGTLFKIHTSNGQCEATSFVPGQPSFKTFGMGYSTDLGGPSETLFITGTGLGGEETNLGIISPTTFTLSTVGPLAPSLPGMELTGTGDGRLYGFVADPLGQGTKLVSLDKQTAKVTEEAQLPDLFVGTGWAFAFWGGDFFFFTGAGAPSSVTRFHPADGTSAVVATWPGLIVGAGISTCAPEQ